MYLEGLDNIDRKIIELLSENARMSYVDIGEIVGLSRVAVKSRVLALEERGIIEKYCIIINPQKIGRALSVYFDIETEPQTFYQVVEILNNTDAITQIYHVTGKSNLHVHAIIETENGLDKLLSEVMYCLPGLRSINSNTILSRIKDVKGVRL